jgi:hypothetical protein
VRLRVTVGIQLRRILDKGFLRSFWTVRQVCLRGSLINRRCKVLLSVGKASGKKMPEDISEVSVTGGHVTLENLKRRF